MKLKQFIYLMAALLAIIGILSITLKIGIMAFFSFTSAGILMIMGILEKRNGKAIPIK